LLKSFLSASGIITLGLLLLFVNGISQSLFSSAFVDLTDEGLYTLSAGSKNILGKLEEPIALKFYYSQTDGNQYPSVKLYGSRVVDLLKEYERQSQGKIELDVYDVRPDSEEEEWAQKYGLSPLPLPTGEQLYFGLVATNSFGEEELIPVFNLNRQEFLEFDITKLVHALVNRVKPVVGVISPLKIEGVEAPPPQPGMPPQAQASRPPWVFIEQLKRLVDVKLLGVDVAEVPEAIDVLMVLHPKNLPEQTRYAIDQYAVRGGKLFIAVDPYCVMDSPEAPPSNPMMAFSANRSSNLPELFKTWGLQMSDRRVVGDLHLAPQVNTRQGDQPVRMPAWVAYGESEKSNEGEPLVNDREVITSNLDTVIFAWPGGLEIDPKDGVEYTKLFTTTKGAMLFEENDIRFTPDDPEELMRKFTAGSKSYSLGVKIHGALKSSFDARPGETEAGDSNSETHLSEGSKKASIIVMSDVDFLADPYSVAVQNLLGTRVVSLLNDNLIFAANAIEILSGSDDLIALRSRGRFTRPFTKVQDIEAKAHEKWKSEEERLKARLNKANLRLSQLQSGSSQSGELVGFNNAMLDEIEQYRSERKEAQNRLREVRRNLREDKERLGTRLFLVNTFIVPIILILLSLALHRRRRMRSGKAG
jgi:ABC-type uncharacterized transport system involved in gliding motility auxiliary subunit